MATVADLKARAKQLKITGYSSMKKAELHAAILKATLQQPLTTTEREWIYRRQNNTSKLTPRQMRRMRHKHNRNGF